MARPGWHETAERGRHPLRLALKWFEIRRLPCSLRFRLALIESQEKSNAGQTVFSNWQSMHYEQIRQVEKPALRRLLDLSDEGSGHHSFGSRPVPQALVHFVDRQAETEAPFEFLEDRHQLHTDIAQTRSQYARINGSKQFL